ncbi:MAG: hypothetical protein ABII13_04700 [Patescibacteria group bacterium]|nr:hypothetical protein [Patescibacteria group bacterium]MBU2509655.1 hypothetical protein [Patescibacteria group bacterium]
MKALRFLGITFIKFIVTTFGLFTLYALILPDVIPGWGINIITWIITFALAYLFAYWAVFNIKPNRKDTLLLVFIWLLVTVTGFLLYGILYSVQGPWLLVRPEILVQLVLEVLAILMVAYQVRHKKVEEVVEI